MINAIRDLQLFTSIFTKFFCGESTSTFIRFLDWPEGIIFRACKEPCKYGESGRALKERILGPKINNAEKSDYFDKMETSPNNSLWMWEEGIILTDGSGDKPVPTLASVSGPLAGTMMVHTRLFVLNNNREERGVFTRTFSLIIVEHMSWGAKHPDTGGRWTNQRRGRSKKICREFQWRPRTWGGWWPSPARGGQKLYETADWDYRLGGGVKLGIVRILHK